MPEWVYADMGILCAGGVSSGIYPTDSAVQVEYLINDSSTRVIFAEDEEQPECDRRHDEEVGGLIWLA